MHGNYLYKITIEPICLADNERQQPFSFEVTSHDDIVDLIDRAQAAALQKADEIPAMVVGLKLLGEVALQNTGNKLFEPLRNSLCDCILKTQSLSGDK